MSTVNFMEITVAFVFFIHHCCVLAVADAVGTVCKPWWI